MMSRVSTSLKFSFRNPAGTSNIDDGGQKHGTQPNTEWKSLVKIHYGRHE